MTNKPAIVFSTIYSWIERLSRGATILTILIFGLLRLFGFELNLSAQIIIAMVGLLVGIPHGAIDHLISLPFTPRHRFYLYIGAYIAIAIIAGWLIANWNVLGFQLVILMSALHFGYGDAAYREEWLFYKKEKGNTWFITSTYAIPAGFAPVILPLTDSHSTSALARIHPAIENWAGSHSQFLRVLVLGVAIAATLLFLSVKKFNLAIDLLLLLALSITAPPLVAFAIYFGFWHAARHTARLVPKLKKGGQRALEGDARGALMSAVTPGLYAVVGAIAVGTALMYGDRAHFGSGLLWSLLVVIWSLTVPHMLSTARFDGKALLK